MISRKKWTIIKVWTEFKCLTQTAEQLPVCKLWQAPYRDSPGAGGHLLWLGEVRRSPPPFFVNLSLCLGRPCFGSSDVFLFCWAAFLSISLLASVFPVSLPLFFLFFRPCLIHARLPEGGRAFVHGLTFLHSWCGPMTVVIGLLHGATFLSGFPLVLFVSFIGPS